MGQKYRENIFRNKQVIEYVDTFELDERFFGNR